MKPLKTETCNSDEVLKPCPFCGGKATFAVAATWTGVHHNEFHKEHFVICNKCGAKSPSQTEYNMHPDCCKIIGKNKWNKREGE